jgi:Zn-dependent peptidase ImmA (M78 family)/DNA-binding XRE family transcriptional regulator
VDTARRPLDAKYINTSDEVVGFDKKKALFRDAAEGVEGNEVVVTEGPLDAMAARSAGEKAVALSGTRLSREHTDILRDVADDPDQTKAVVILDGDQAGRDGTRDSLEALQREGIEADVVRLPEGQDLDEYIRENGAEEWRRYKAGNRQTAGRSCCREGEPASAPHNRNRGFTMAIGAKIKQARKLRSLSQRDLAKRLPVSDQTVSKYEREESLPDSTRLMEIADALDVDLSYFLRAPRVGDIEPAYRTERSNLIKVKEKDALIERIRNWLERYLEVESILHFDDLSFEWPDGLPREVASLDDVEDAALALRDAWKIGRDPIETLTERLEDKALRVGSLEAPDAFDACAFVAAVNGGTPVIVFNEDRSGDRQRFTIAHELGHLVLDVQGGLSEEKACHRFSGAFLVPRDIFVQDVGEQRKKVSLRELELLKEKYGIGMQALIDRMRDLGIVNKHYAGRLSDWFEDSGHKKEEPGEPVPREHPQRFERMIEHALAEDLISKRRAAELLDRDADRLSAPVLA